MTAPTRQSIDGSLTPEHCATLSRASDDSLGATLAGVLSGLPADLLPLLACCSRGGMPDGEDWSLSNLSVHRSGGVISARLGLFFTEMVGGCNCHDDPSRFTDYRVLTAEIDCVSGSLSWTVDKE